MSVKAAKLKERITVEKPVYVSDLLGGFITSWDKYASIWAQVAPTGQQQRLRNEKLEVVNQYKVVIRAVKGLSSDMRINYKGKTLKMRSFVPTGENGEVVEIIAEEVK